jgi:hypothetical protein
MWDTVSPFFARTDTPRLLLSLPLSRKRDIDKAMISMQSFLGNSPLERGAFSSVEMEKAGCVEMRAAVKLPELLTKTSEKSKIDLIWR